MAGYAVVFDIGGVLIDWNPAYLYRKLLSSDAEVSEFLGNICTLSWNEQFDAGKAFADGIAELVRKHPEHSDLIEAYWLRWDEMIGGEVPGTAQVLERLKAAGVSVHAISNWSAETFPRARSRFPFLELFDVLVLSGREGLVKPGSPIFELFLKRVGVPADRCIFIDDNLRNVETAAALGFKTVHFKSAVELEHQLADYGVLHSSVRALA